MSMTPCLSLGFLEFGFATREFDITRERLGVYRQEEHIGNTLPNSEETYAHLYQIIQQYYLRVDGVCLRSLMIH